MADVKLLFLCGLITVSHGFIHRFHKLNVELPTGDAGEPLFLTPLIESGKIEEAKSLALVTFTETLKVQSYAGYFTVNKTYDSNQFFWYFPAMVPDKIHAPVVIWLQGGPGASSLYGLFTENGPLRVQHKKLQRRKHSWAVNHHVIYVDNPVGTGFSFTKDPKGYAKDQVQVGEELYKTMVQFFKMFPELQKCPFYVTGESYAGKYVPALAYTIHQKNQDADLKINLKGVAIGNGLSDPENQMLYGKYLYQLGLIDWNQAEVFEMYENKTRKYIQSQQWEKAFDTFDELLNGDLINGQTVFHNMSGYTTYFNYLHTKERSISEEDFSEFLSRTEVRRDLHVGNLPFNNGSEVERNLKADVMKSVAPWVAELINNYDVAIYNGQLDIIVAYPLTVNYLRNLKFNGSDLYATAKRHIWEVDGEVAGYVKHAGNLVEIMVRDAGHMVPADQPKWAWELITHLTHEKRFH